MRTLHNLVKLVSERGILKGGFSVLTLSQLDKLRGGCVSSENKPNAGNCSNSSNCGNCYNCACGF